MSATRITWTGDNYSEVTDFCNLGGLTEMRVVRADFGTLDIWCDGAGVLRHGAWRTVPLGGVIVKDENRRLSLERAS